jgi:hypothetical protein
MVASFQKTLKDYLKMKNFNVKSYFGEFDKPDTAEVLKTFLPCVMVDFVESTPDGLFREEATFSLYLVHLAYSKQEETRKGKDYALLDFIKDVKDALHVKSIEDNEPINVTKIKKIFDAAKGQSYMTVYLMSFNVTLIDKNYTNGEVE